MQSKNQIRVYFILYLFIGVSHFITSMDICVLDIWSWNRLETVLRNLREEILDRIEEEKHRHKRLTKQVRLGYTFEDRNGERLSDNTLLDVSSKTEVIDLYHQGRTFILKDPDFDRVKFRIIELKFTINEFIAM